VTKVATPPREAHPVRSIPDTRPAPDSPSKAWDGHVHEWLEKNRQKLWRQHSDAVNAALVDRWLPAQPLERVLKTDLFDEAVADGLYQLLARRARYVEAIDVSPVVLSLASRKYPAMHTFAADVRNLSCESDSIDAVVSLSTLDHFDAPADIAAALCELHRVLKPGGTLILTLDNSANPIVAIRNLLPYKLTHGVGLAPYPAGFTYGPVRLHKAVESAGFAIEESTTILHAPRVLAIPVVNALDRRGWIGMQALALRALMAFETLGVLPTRKMTGHFVAVRATKKLESGAPRV
jgi:SAM-dependent methyltransferase